MTTRVCVVGLGNPGSRYQGTRHNIGFEWVDAACNSLLSKARFTEKYDSLWCQGSITLGDEEFELHFLKPQTFMNESGRALSKWRSKNQGDLRILSAFDDMDIALGRLRLRYQGSDGGHRGIRSLIEHWGSNEIPRIRLGVGRPTEGASEDEVVDYVLKKFLPAERKIVDQLLKDAGDQLKAFLQLDQERAMNAVNAKSY